MVVWILVAPVFMGCFGCCWLAVFVTWISAIYTPVWGGVFSDLEWFWRLLVMRVSWFWGGVVLILIGFGVWIFVFCL